MARRGTLGTAAEQERANRRRNPAVDDLGAGGLVGARGSLVGAGSGSCAVAPGRDAREEAPDRSEAPCSAHPIDARPTRPL